MSLSLKNIRWNKVLAACALAAVASVAGAADTLARFADGEVITSDDLSAYLDRRVDLRDSSRNAWGVEIAVGEMAMVRALSREGEAMGEARTKPGEKLRFDEVYSQAIYTKLMPTCPPPVDEAAARKFFKDHPEAFRVPAMARLSRVILRSSEMMNGEPASGWMQAQAMAVASGKTTFDDVVKQAEKVYRLDPQGDLGWVTLTDEASILRILASAKQGEMVGPVKEGDFTYLFLIVDKRESRQVAWEDVAVSVPRRAVTFCRQEASKKVREDLFKKYGVELDQAAIRGLFTKQSAAK